MRSFKGLQIVGERPSGNRIAMMRIGADWQEGTGQEWLEVTSPATGELVGHVPLGTHDDAEHAIAVANAHRDAIASLSVWERAELCLRIADTIDSRRESLANLLALEQGKPYHTEALREVAAAADAFRASAGQMKWLETAYFPVGDKNKRAFSTLRPKGVISVITPWNFPVAQPCEYYLAPGLMTGNAMVWLPAPTTCFVAEALMECMIEAGVPDGVVNLVYGEGPVVGDELVGNPGTNIVAFTGSSETGAIVANRGAGKTLMLELGGNGPSVVLDDADIERAARRIARGAFVNAGQICTATERVLVHDSVHDLFVEHVIAEAAQVRLGPSFSPQTTMGPLNNEAGALKMDEHLDDARANGATIAFGGKRSAEHPTRLYYEPTVVTGLSADSRLNVDETFGPVIPVLAFGDDEELFNLVSSSRMGLSGAVFTRSITRGFQYAERLNCGIVNINEMSSYWESHIPAGGAAGTASGVGRTGGKHTLLEMSDLKTITVDLSET